MKCEHVYLWVDGHFECQGCGKQVDYDIMARDFKEIE